MAFCTTCGTQIPDGVAVCPACSRSAESGPSAPSAVTGGLTDNIAGMLAYVIIIPAIVFLVLEPYNKNRFIRFHSFQSIFFGIAGMVLFIALSIVVRIPFLGWLTMLFGPLIGLGGLVIWLVLLLKAYQGQMFKLPIIGDAAETQANAN